MNAFLMRPPEKVVIRRTKNQILSLQNLDLKVLRLFDSAFEAILILWRWQKSEVDSQRQRHYSVAELEMEKVTETTTERSFLHDLAM